MSFVMRLGWPGFRPSLLPFWNLGVGLGLAMAFPFSLRTLHKQITTHASCDFSISRFRIPQI
jgi:hypothetical protein